ncbi:hypothetical protein VM98_34765, partial [Streptomyces rubellomurinus subsp. indigoferus]
MCALRVVGAAPSPYARGFSSEATKAPGSATAPSGAADRPMSGAPFAFCACAASAAKPCRW